MTGLEREIAVAAFGPQAPTKGAVAVTDVFGPFPKRIQVRARCGCPCGLEMIAWIEPGSDRAPYTLGQFADLPIQGRA